MRNLFLILIYVSFFSLKSGIKVKANTFEKKDLSCITLLKVAREKNK